MAEVEVTEAERAGPKEARAETGPEAAAGGGEGISSCVAGSRMVLSEAASENMSNADGLAAAAKM